MKHKKIFDNLVFLAVLLIGISFWATWIITSHPKHAIVSWDEGFHGGAALFISYILKDPANIKDYLYFAKDFVNGLLLYMPLWWLTAGTMGAIFTPSIEIYRFTTLIFSVLSIILIALFTKSISNTKSAIIAAATLAFAPIFIVYSHLMMIEVPLLFSSSLAIIVFYVYLTKEELKKRDLLVTLIAFVLGVLTKVTAIALIFGTVFSFGLLIFLFFKNDKIYKQSLKTSFEKQAYKLVYKRFYSFWTVIFLLSSALTFLIYQIIPEVFFKVNMLSIYINQMKQMSGEQSNFLTVIVRTLFDNFTFYFTDFSHMPALTTIWFGSLLALLIIKRDLLTYFLLIWTLVNYFLFSAVKPQAIQYILPIFVPLSIATGIFWGQVLNFRKNEINYAVLVFLVVGIGFTGLFYLDASESIVWRNSLTYQQQASQYVIENAKFGDRILSTGDGTRFLIHLYDTNKKLQPINAAKYKCTTAMEKIIDWIIIDNGPQSPIKIEVINDSDWLNVKHFPSMTEPTLILKNNLPNNKSFNCPKILH